MVRTKRERVPPYLCRTDPQWRGVVVLSAGACSAVRVYSFFFTTRRRIFQGVGDVYQFEQFFRV